MKALVSARDVEFLRRFEACALPEKEWTHLAHLRIAWICLATNEHEIALARLRTGILRFNTEVLRRRHQYHETVTVAFTRIVADRMRETEDWVSFSHRIEDLLSADDPILLRYYSKSLLNSDRARQEFVPPDLAQLPAFEVKAGAQGG